MICQNCGKDRVLSVSGNTSDMCHSKIQNKKRDGYVPCGANIGGGDYLEFKVCLDCGQMQGKWPVEINGFLLEF